MTDLRTGWEWARLDEVADIQGGIQKQAKRRPILNKYPFLRVANVTRGRLDLSEIHEVELFEGELERYQLKAGDLLVVEGNGSIDQLGRAAMWHGQIANCVHQNHLIRVRPALAINPQYLEYLWNSPITITQIEKIGASTSGLHTLSVSKLRPIIVPVPPLAEQHRIVADLERHLTHIEVATASLRSVRHKIASLVSSHRHVATTAFASGTQSLGDVLIDIEAGKSFAVEGRPAADDEWGIIKVSAMTWGEFRQDENKAVPQGREIDVRCEIKPGDLLISRANTEKYVGAPVLVHDTRPKLLLSDKSLRLVPKKSIDLLWLAEVLASPAVRSQISARATGMKDSMRNISQKSLREIRIPHATPQQQACAIRALSDIHLEALRLRRQIHAVERREDIFAHHCFETRSPDDWYPRIRTMSQRRCCWRRSKLNGRRSQRPGVPGALRRTPTMSRGACCDCCKPRCSAAC